MANSYSTSSTKGFGQRILGSIIGIPIGILLVVVSIGVLFWNEGRFDLSKLAKTAIEIKADQPLPANAEGKLVAVKGAVVSSEKIGDVYLQPGEYLALDRKSEMFAWEEKREDDTTNNSGGSSTTTTTYVYNKVWADKVMDSNNFNRGDEYVNPPKTIESLRNKVASASIGVYKLDFNKIDLPQLVDVNLDTTNVILADNFELTNDNKIFKGMKYADPQIGEIRIGYSALNNNFAGTVMGRASGTNIETFIDKDNHKLYRLFEGSKQDAIATLHNEFKTLLWLFRIGGLVAIFLGITMLLGPLTTLMSFFPTLGKIGSAAVATIAIPITLLLGGSTILVGMIAHSPVALVITLVIVAVVSVFIIKSRAKKIA